MFPNIETRYENVLPFVGKFPLKSQVLGPKVILPKVFQAR